MNNSSRGNNLEEIKDSINKVERYICAIGFILVESVETPIFGLKGVPWLTFQTFKAQNIGLGEL